jgi:DNA-binding response OmpR family regulator
VLCKPVPVEELLSQVRVALRQGAARSPNPQPA